MAEKSVSTNFRVCAAPESWSKSWEPLLRSHFNEIFQFWKIVSSLVPRNERANSLIFPKKIDHLLHFKRSIAFDFKIQKYFWFKQNFKPKVQKVKQYPSRILFYFKRYWYKHRQSPIFFILSFLVLNYKYCNFCHSWTFCK